MKPFSKFSAIIIEIFGNFFEIFQNNPQNFGNISCNFKKYFWKFLEIFRDNFRNFSKWFSSKNSKMSKVFLESSKIFWNDFWNFSINFQNFPIHFTKFYEMNLKILRDNPRNFSTFFKKFFKIIIKSFVNISWNFQKYFWKFSKIVFEIFRNGSVLKIFQNSWSDPKYFSIMQFFFAVGEGEHSLFYYFFQFRQFLNVYFKNSYGKVHFYLYV